MTPTWDILMLIGAAGLAGLSVLAGGGILLRSGAATYLALLLADALGELFRGPLAGPDATVPLWPTDDDATVAIVKGTIFLLVLGIGTLGGAPLPVRGFASHAFRVGSTALLSVAVSTLGFLTMMIFASGGSLAAFREPSLTALDGFFSGSEILSLAWSLWPLALALPGVLILALRGREEEK